MLVENARDYPDDQVWRDNEDKRAFEIYANGTEEDWGVEGIGLVENKVYTYQVTAKSALKR